MKEKAICNLCGAEFRKTRARQRRCSECEAVQNQGKLPRIRKRDGIASTGAVFEGEGWNVQPQSEKIMNMVLGEARQEKGESPFDYGKIMARLGVKK